MIEMQAVYQTPGMVEIAFKFGGPLCQSQFGSGNEGFVPDEENPDIDF